MRFMLTIYIQRKNSGFRVDPETLTCARMARIWTISSIGVRQRADDDETIQEIHWDAHVETSCLCLGSVTAQADEIGCLQHALLR